MATIKFGISVPARKFCLRAKVAPTTHFWGPDFSRKGQCTSIFLICKREETVGNLRKWKWQFTWSWHGASLFLHNRGNLRYKVNSTIRMYAIKKGSFFFHFIFHFTVKICFLSLLLNCFASIHFFVTYWGKTFDRPWRCVCQVYSFSGKNVMLAWAPAIYTWAKSRLSGLQTTHCKSGILKKIHRLIF